VHGRPVDGAKEGPKKNQQQKKVCNPPASQTLILVNFLVSRHLKTP
jgi:hypothetical protein